MARVVCIAPFTQRAALGEIVPKVNQIYTIRGARGAYLLLDEIVNIPRQYLNGFQEVAFNSNAFRPYIEFKNDISVLQRKLERVNKRNKEKTK